MAPGVRPATAQQKPSLYHRLGGYDALAAVTDDFIHRLATDPKLHKFFVGVSQEHAGRIRQLVLDQLCGATGGPCVYIGREMKEVHRGLNITDDDWQSAITDLTGTLDKFHVKEPERGEVFGLMAKLKPEIVNVK
jgi:hemoglobin